MEIIEEMVLFKPDLVIFCAGFDAHDEDPLASVELTEEDFAWATETGNLLLISGVGSFHYLRFLYLLLLSICLFSISSFFELYYLLFQASVNVFLFMCILRFFVASFLSFFTRFLCITCHSHKNSDGPFVLFIFNT